MKRTRGVLGSCGPARARARRFAVSMLAAAPAIAGAWLFLAALPALADGGPHIAQVNSGASSLTADSCAGCHRAHTAQGQFLLAATSEEALCLSCHGAQSAGATTDVVTGVQYVSGAAHDVANGAGTQLGALRSGGFVQARIDASSPARIYVSVLPANNLAKVRVSSAPAAVTSAHLDLPANGLTAPQVAWGNGAIGSGPGPTVSLTCADCHNPHGNGRYRILNPIPDPTASGPVPFTPASATAPVTDSAIDPNGDLTYPTKNYTVLQVKGTPGSPATYLLYASDVLDARSATPSKTWPAGDYSAAGGDYWHSRVPWNSRTGYPDAPNGIPFDSGNGFDEQMSAWCTSCHTRYYATSSFRTGDSIFTYRHKTIDYEACTTCHVAHGSNAQMAPGGSSATMPFPNGATTPTGDSRLLKVDNRGTCQLCHDPTGTVTTSPPTYSGPSATPGVP